MNESYIGQIMLFAGDFAPAGWALCNGQLLPINQNPALFAVLGNRYGGDGVSVFALPDLRGRAPIHFGQGRNLANYALADKGGEETVSLTLAQMPNHTHSVGQGCSSESGGEESPVNNYLSPVSPGIYSKTTNAQMQTKDSSAAGGGMAHENRSPYLVLNYCIATTGIFPSRA